MSEQLASRTLIRASAPKFANNEDSAIALVAEFAELKSFGPIPFIADRDDVSPHGREIFARAISGEFGAIAAYASPAA